MEKTTFLAVDIGAGSGRVLCGSMGEERLFVKEVYRFPNGMTERDGRLTWDIHRIFANVSEGLRQGAEASGFSVHSIGIDTWGVDFGLLDAEGALLDFPFAYRDSRNEGAMAEYLNLLPKESIYGLTGIQFLQFNSLFQLYAIKTFNPEMLERAENLLFIPDLLNYFLTGIKSTEFTFATTSQMFNPWKMAWEEDLFQAMDVPSSLMLPVAETGTYLGKIREGRKTPARMAGVPVISVASHDTAAAVAAVPALDRDWAFISSGTWSIMGVERETPVISPHSLRLNFTNEGGVGGTFRLCKNISGLWLLEECRRAWSGIKKYDYEELIKMAESAPPFYSLIDPDWTGFLNPENMPKAVDAYCRLTRQPSPQNHGAYVRCILESLALKYMVVLSEIRELHSSPIRRIHLIGGGVRNTLLCRFTADATGLPVTAGPAEATAVGNLLVQGLGTDVFQSIEEMRAVVRRSFSVKEYRPVKTNNWEAASLRFRGMMQHAAGLSS